MAYSLIFQARIRCENFVLAFSSLRLYAVI